MFDCELKWEIPAQNMYKEVTQLGRLTGKVAVVTGGGAGLGRGFSLAMAKEIGRAHV